MILKYKNPPAKKFKKPLDVTAKISYIDFIQRRHGANNDKKEKENERE
jgi:hypothetical protein